MKKRQAPTMEEMILAYKNAKTPGELIEALRKIEHEINAPGSKMLGELLLGSFSAPGGR